MDKATKHEAQLSLEVTDDEYLVSPAERGAAPSLLQAAGVVFTPCVLGHDEQGKYLGIVADAQIEFQNRSGGNVAQVASDKNGYYKVDLPPGNTSIKLSREATEMKM